VTYGYLLAAVPPVCLHLGTCAFACLFFFALGDKNRQGGFINTIVSYLGNAYGPKKKEIQKREIFKRAEFAKQKMLKIAEIRNKTPKYIKELSDSHDKKKMKKSLKFN
jgi:hypothetical protein